MKNIEMKTDEMAAESEYFEYHGCLTGDCPHNSTKECLTYAYVTGCKHKTEQLSNGSVSFDERAARLARPQQGCEFCWSETPFVEGARWQHAQLSPIIAAQAERLKAAERLIERLEADIKRRITSDDKCGNPFDEDLGDALNAIEKFRKGEG